MTAEPTKDLGLALWELENILAERPAETGGNVWGRLVRHCNRGSVDYRFVTPVEDEVRGYVAGLSEADKREIWSQTETGQLNAGDAESWMIGDIEMDLESELLAGVLEHAFRQAEESAQKRRRGRTKRSR